MQKACLNTKHARGFTRTLTLEKDKAKLVSGFTLIEVILALSLFALLVTALAGAYIYGEQSVMLSGARGRALALAEEGLAAARNIRDSGYANLTNGAHGLAVASNQWNFSGASDATSVFTRAVTVADAGSNRKSVTSTVTWQQNLQRTGSISLTTYLTNFARQVFGNWANPTQQALINTSGNQDGLKVQTEGNYAYLINNGGNPDFLVIDVSNPGSPTTVGSLSLSGTPLNIFVSGNYAYVANNSNSQEMQIIDISNPSSPTVVGTYNDAGNEDGLGVYVVGNYAYLVLNGGDDLVIINVTNKSSPTKAGSVVLSGAPYELVVVGNYAYIVSDFDAEEIQVVNVANPATPTQVGSLNFSGVVDATTIAYYGSYLYVGEGTFFQVVSISNPTTPSLSGTLTFSDDITDIALDTANNGSYVFLSTMMNAGEFQVVDTSNPASPSVFGSYNTAGTNNLLGIAYSTTLDRAFGASAANANEFIVFQPQ